MPYCTHCGKELQTTDSFCPKCGLRVGAPAQPVQPPAAGVVPGARGLGRNTLLQLTSEGLLGFQIQPDTLLFFAFILPVPILALIWYLIQFGSLAFYITLWVASSGLLYDELRWRGLRAVGGAEGRASWLVPWNSIRMADWNGRTLWFSSTGQARKLSVTFDQNDAPSVQESLTSAGVKYSWRGPRFPAFLTRFTALAILLFVISQIILISAATLPFVPGEEVVYRGVLNNTTSQLANSTFFEEYRAIFLNNVQVALGGAIPFLGTLAFGIASYSTGRVIQVIAINQGVSPFRLLLELYVLPHTWVEESAYPVAAVAGMLGVTRWRSVTPSEFTRRWNWGSTKLMLALGGAGLILLAAGFIETVTTYIGVLALAIWVPLFVGYYLLSRQRGHRNRLS